MPYLFAFLVAVNAVFMGYNLLQQEKRAGKLPTAVTQYYPDATAALGLMPADADTVAADRVATPQP